jgi:hypothetical protein
MPQTQTQDPSDQAMDAEVERLLNDLLSPVPESDRKKIADATHADSFAETIRKICGF